MAQQTAQRPGVALAARYAADLTAKFADEYGHPQFTVDPRGRKYLRVVVQNDYPGAQRFVHCFVDAAHGYVWKDAGWAGPAPHPRGDLATEEGYAAALEAADPYGSYLYAR